MSILKPLYIFDLDGTLANIDHRIYHLSKNTKEDQKWRDFYAACHDDLPIAAVIRTMASLYQAGSDLLIFTARSDEVRQKTENWLLKNTHLSLENLEELLYMRKLGDHQPDTQLKKKWYNELSEEDKSRLVAVFEDRSSVTAMWRSLGVACFQVAPGDF